MALYEDLIFGFMCTARLRDIIVITFKHLEMLSVVTEVLYTFTAITHAQQTILE